MKIYLLLLLLCFSILVHAQRRQLQGRVINEQMQNAVGALVINLSAYAETNANGNGLYSITASVGDTLCYRFVGVADEKRIVVDISRHINVVLMNKTVNDLGAIWTKRMWSKAERQVASRYHKLEKEAKMSGKWNY